MSVRLRDFRESDIVGISDIHEKQPGLGVPSLSNVITNRTVVDGDKVLGYGVLKHFAEAVLIVDNDISIRQRAEVARQVMYCVIADATLAGLEQLYLTTNHKGWQAVIQKHYGFVQCPDPFFLLNLER